MVKEPDTTKEKTPYKLGGSFIKIDDTIKGILSGKSTRQAMVDSGYSQSYANASTTFMSKKRVQARMKDIINELREERDQALSLMKEKRSEAKYGDLMNSTEKLTKLIQLLEGNPTERLEVQSLEEDIRNIAKL